MNSIILIIGKCFHKIKNDPIDNKDRKAQYELSCNAATEIERIKNNSQ